LKKPVYRAAKIIFKIFKGSRVSFTISHSPAIKAQNRQLVSSKVASKQRELTMASHSILGSAHYD
jgi:hypothetical protein